MYFDPKLVKKFLVTILIIAGLFFGYQLVSDSDIEETKVEIDTKGVENQAKQYEFIEGGQVDFNEEENLEATMSGESDMKLKLEDDQYGNTIQFSNSFEHTKPGEFSEIIVDASGFEPDEFTIVYVRKAGTEEYIAAGGQEHTADADGNISARFIITEFGEYEVFLSSQGDSHVSPVIVVK